MSTETQARGWVSDLSQNGCGLSLSKGLHDSSAQYVLIVFFSIDDSPLLKHQQLLCGYVSRCLRLTHQVISLHIFFTFSFLALNVAIEPSRLTALAVVREAEIDKNALDGF